MEQGAVQKKLPSDYFPSLPHSWCPVPPPASLTRGHNDFAPQAFLVAQLVENPPSMTDIWVRSLGWEDPLEKGKATHSSILAWRVPWTVYSPRGRRESDMTEQLSLV